MLRRLPQSTGVLNRSPGVLQPSLIILLAAACQRCTSMSMSCMTSVGATLRRLRNGLCHACPSGADRRSPLPLGGRVRRATLTAAYFPHNAPLAPVNDSRRRCRNRRIPRPDGNSSHKFA